MKHIFYFSLCILSFQLVLAQQKHSSGDSLPQQRLADTMMKMQELDSVIVAKKKPLYEIQSDKIVVDVKEMISGTSGNVAELLEKIPGITIDASGNISLNGKGGIMVMINGRTNYLSGADLINYLKSLPGASLDKVELIDNPSSRLDANAGGAINLKLKRSLITGLTGSLSSGFSQGIYSRSNHALNLNLNVRKISFFANVGFNTDKNYNDDKFDRKYYDEDGALTSSVLLYNHQVNKGKGYNINAGMDYNLSPESTVGISVGGNYGMRDHDFNYTNNVYDPTGSMHQSGSGVTAGKDDRRSSNAMIYYQRQFKEIKSELTADVNYFSHISTGDRFLQNRYDNIFSSIDSSDMFRYYLPSDIHIYVAKADYVQQLGKTTKVEAGVKYSNIRYDNLSDQFDKTESGEVKNVQLSNHFKYGEQISAAYLTADKRSKRLQVQAGLRVENAKIGGEQLNTLYASKFTRSNTQLFPSIFVTYKLDTVGKKSLGIVALKRINRPSYHQLNPFVYWKDRFSYTTGNPALMPQYQYRLELKYNHGQVLWVGLSYNHFDGVIFSTTTNVDDVFIVRPENVARGFMLLLNTGVNLSPTNWWQSNSVIRVSRMGIRGKVDGQDLRPDAFVVRLELMNQFRISKLWAAELGGYYASKDLNGQTFTRGLYRVHFAVQKKIFRERGSLRFNMEDVFHTWVYRNRSISLKQADYTQVSESDTQRAGISFNYRFGKDGNNRKRKGSGSDEERSRVD